MKVLLDTNILIYSAAPNTKGLQSWLGNQTLYISPITELEALGYHRLTTREYSYFSSFINLCFNLPVTETIIKKAIQLRQKKSMSLGDAIIAATAITEDLVLATANEKDFRHLREIQIINPLLEQ